MRDLAIRVEGLSKRYRLGAKPRARQVITHAAKNMVKTVIGRPPTPPLNTTFWALRGVSFEVPKGQMVGIIGRNGAGKSTLLKVISRVTEPTEGRITLKGRVGSLLEIGTGFHGDLTGRQNIGLNAAILGINPSELKGVFDELVDFSGVEHFIDTPVKYYSSGMYVRLAFSVAVYMRPDILVLDEVLAVGDVAFQKKCLKKIEEITQGGQTVLFVSHSMASISNMCDRCLLLENGELIGDGETNDVIAQYLETCFQDVTVGSVTLDMPRSGTGAIRFTHFQLEDINGREIKAIQCGQDVVFAFGYEVTWPLDRIRDVAVGFGLMTAHNVTLFAIYNEYKEQLFEDLPPRGMFRCRVDRFPMTPGSYKVGARLVVNREESDWPQGGVGEVTVVEGDFYRTGSVGFSAGAFLVDGSWSLHPVE